MNEMDPMTLYHCYCLIFMFVQNDIGFRFTNKDIGFYGQNEQNYFTIPSIKT